MPASAPRTVRAQLLFFILFFAVLLLFHAPVLSLPYFWDELGQFVPAALDIQREGAWVPKSTLPNVHPPGVMAYLAAVWSVFGYSVTVTRVAMLALAALGVLGAFLLAIELCRNARGFPAFTAVLLLLLSPLFWAQSMMAQLDMPAMVFTMFGMLLFLQQRYVSSAVACTLLVLMKETSIVAPAVFGALLLWERRVRDALWFLLPAVAVAGWLAILYRSTGYLFGNPEFTHYNTTFQFHPVRLPVTVVRRLFYIFVDNFHFIGTAAILLAWRRTDVFRTRAWAITAAVTLLQTVAVSVLGGAALERYLTPVLPIFYIAAAAALSTFAGRQRAYATVALAGGLFACVFLNSPLAYPFENNSAFVSFVRLQHRAARVLEAEYSDGLIASAWPLPDALRRPEFGYVSKPLRVRGVDNFNAGTVLRLAREADVLVIYSRTWEPEWGVLQSAWVREFLKKYYLYEPQITRQQIERGLGLVRVGRWEERGQWIEIYAQAARAGIPWSGH